jgi:hypothetical protein
MADRWIALCHGCHRVSEIGIVYEVKTSFINVCVCMYMYYTQVYFYTFSAICFIGFAAAESLSTLLPLCWLNNITLSFASGAYGAFRFRKNLFKMLIVGNVLHQIHLHQKLTVLFYATWLLTATNRKWTCSLQSLLLLSGTNDLCYMQAKRHVFRSYFYSLTLNRKQVYSFLVLMYDSN